MGCGKQREATAPIQSLVKLQPWFLSLRWKNCVQQNCSPSSCASIEIPALGQNTLMVMMTAMMVVVMMMNTRVGAKGDWDFRTSDQLKNPDGTDNLTPVVNFDEVRKTQLAKSSLFTSTLVPLGYFQIF